MALVKIIDNVVVTPDGTGCHNLSMRLRLFANGANPETDEPLMECEKTGLVKSYVGGLTQNDLIARATEKIIKEFQIAIDAYIIRQNIAKKIDTKAIESRLDISKAGA